MILRLRPYQESHGSFSAFLVIYIHYDVYISRYPGDDVGKIIFILILGSGLINKERRILAFNCKYNLIQSNF